MVRKKTLTVRELMPEITVDRTVGGWSQTENFYKQVLDLTQKFRRGAELTNEEIIEYYDLKAFLLNKSLVRRIIYYPGGRSVNNSPFAVRNRNRIMKKRDSSWEMMRVLRYNYSVGATLQVNW